jgi:hypothetical protein
VAVVQNTFIHENTEQHNETECTAPNIHNNKNNLANKRTHNTIIKIYNIKIGIYNVTIGIHNLKN